MVSVGVRGFDEVDGDSGSGVAGASMVPEISAGSADGTSPGDERGSSAGDLASVALAVGISCPGGVSEVTSGTGSSVGAVSTGGGGVLCHGCAEPSGTIVSRISGVGGVTAGTGVVGGISGEVKETLSLGSIEVVAAPTSDVSSSATVEVSSAVGSTRSSSESVGVTGEVAVSVVSSQGSWAFNGIARSADRIAPPTSPRQTTTWTKEHKRRFEEFIGMRTSWV